MLENGDVERRLTTIVAIDVVGYSRMMADDEAGTLNRIKTVQSEVVEPACSRHRGRIVKFIGDGILMEFASVVDAVTFAADLQRRMAERNAAADDPPFLMRLGINIGDVIVSDGDIYGDGVNVAARLEALAEPGGICVSGGVFDHARGKVPFGFEDLGAQSVKNIPDPVRVYRLVPEGQAQPVAARATEWRLPRWPALAAMASVLVIAGAVFWLWPHEPRMEPAVEAQMAFPLPDKPSIVVLPFNDLSEAAGPAFFADGLTEDLITDLSKVSGLFVIARNSSFAYKGQAVTIKQVAEDLGVRFVLEGSVRRVDGKLRVNAQLIDATTGGSVWADRFDGDVAGVFQMQDEFVLKIVHALELELSDTQMSEIAEGETAMIEAKEAFQRGWDLYSRFNEQDNARAVSHFERAVELDPGFGRAYGALALVYLRASIFHWEAATGYQRAELYRVVVPRYLQKASAHPTALVHVVRAMRHLFFWHGTSREGTNSGTDDARREAGLAIALQPSDPEAHITMAWALIAAGQPREGLNFVRAAMRLNPTYPSHYVFFEAAAHFALGDLEVAARALRAGLERDPQATALAPLAASVQARLGRRAEAREALATWQLGADQQALEAAVAAYGFPISWVGDSEPLNPYLLDGLRIAALPLEVTVAGLMADLPEQDPEAQVQTLRRLGWFGPAAAPAVAAILQQIGSEQKLVQREAVVTLGKIGPAAKAALPVLREIVDKPIIGFRAREAIQRIGGE